MIGLVIVTHCGLALEFRSALEHVVGPQTQLETDFDRARRRHGRAPQPDRRRHPPHRHRRGRHRAHRHVRRHAVQSRHLGHGRGEGRGDRRHQPADPRQARERAQRDAAWPTRSSSAREAGRKYIKVASQELSGEGSSVSACRRSRTAQRPEAVVTIRNRKGLHARASAKFVKCAESYDAIITVTRDGQAVGGTSIMGLMMLAAGPGSTLHMTRAGPAGPRGAAGAHRAGRGRLRRGLHRRRLKPAAHRGCMKKGARCGAPFVARAGRASTSRGRATRASARCRGTPASAARRRRRCRTWSGRSRTASACRWPSGCRRGRSRPCRR